MKNKLLIVLLIGFIISTSACGKKKEDVPQADSDDANRKQYYTIILESGSYTDKNVEKTYEFDIGDKEYTGKYLITNKYANKDTADVYLYNSDSIPGEKGGMVAVKKGRGDAGDIYEVAIINPLYYGIEIKSFSSDDEAELAFKSFAGSYINTDEYMLKISKKNDEYTYEYVRCIDGVESEEKFFVYYSKNEDSIKFAGKYIGKYENKSLGEFDIEKAEKIAFEKAKKLNDDKEYYVSEKYISTIDGKIGVVFLCCTEDYSGNEIVFVYMD